MADVTNLVEVRGLTKHYERRGTPFARFGAAPEIVRAVDGVDLTIRRGEGVGLVGESGCGKTTTGRLLLRLIEPSRGSIRYDGADVGAMGAADLAAFRRRAQLVFQNPFEALNPRFTLYRSLVEPLANVGVPDAEHEARIRRALDRVHLREPDRLLDKFPHQVSGGQLQRVVLARALVLDPEFIVADEPVSMLDVSVRAGILNVLREAKRDLGLTAVYISHDLALVRYVCERTVVMYLGRVMEDGPTESVVQNPAHPYSKALVAAVPTPDPQQEHVALPILPGRPDATAVPSGCPFRERCPEAHARCAEEVPAAHEIAPNHVVHCHLFDA